MQASSMSPTVADIDQEEQLSNQKSYVLDQESQNEITSEEESPKWKVEPKERVLPQSTGGTGMYAFHNLPTIYVAKSTK